MQRQLNALCFDWPLAIMELMVCCGELQIPSSCGELNTAGTLVAELMRTALNNHPHSTNPKRDTSGMGSWFAERLRGRDVERWNPETPEAALETEANYPTSTKLSPLPVLCNFNGHVSSDTHLSTSWEGKRDM